MRGSGRAQRYAASPYLALLGVALFCIVLITALAALAPASLLSHALERATEGRLTLAGASGRIWSGRGTLLATQGKAAAALAWTLSPWRLARAELAGAVRIGAAEPVRFVATRQRLEVGRTDVVLPAALIAAALGPYDGYKLGGAVRVRAEHLVLEHARAEAVGRTSAETDSHTSARSAGRTSAGGAGRTSARSALALDGLNRVYLDWEDAASGLIAVAPLGSYGAELDVSAQAGTLRLRTHRGPLLVEGSGRWSPDNAALQLSARVSGEHGDTQLETLEAWLRNMTPEQADGSFRFAWPQPATGGRR